MDFKAFEKFVTATNKLCSTIVAIDGKIYATAENSEHKVMFGMYAPEQQPFTISMNTAVNLASTGKVIKAKTITLVDGVAYIDSHKIPYELDGLEGETIPTIEYGDKLGIDGALIERMLDILSEDDVTPFFSRHIFVDEYNNLFATDGFKIAAYFSTGDIKFGNTRIVIPGLIKLLDVGKAQFFTIPNNHGCFVMDGQYFIMYQNSQEIENSEQKINFTITGIQGIFDPVLNDAIYGAKTIIKKDLLNFLHEFNKSYYRQFDIMNNVIKVNRVNISTKKNRSYTEDALTLLEQETDSTANYTLNGEFLYQLAKVFNTNSLVVYQGKKEPVLVRPENDDTQKFIGVIMPMLR